MEVWYGEILLAHNDDLPTDLKNNDDNDDWPGCLRIENGCGQTRLNMMKSQRCTLG